MTRREFINDICDWGDLKDFCYEQGCDLLDCVTTDDGRDDWINEEVDYYQRYEGWRALADFLYNLSQDRYDWWEHAEDGEWYGLNDGSDFDHFKNEVLEWCEDNEVFEPEYAENDAAEESSPENEFFEEEICEEEEEDFEPEDFSVEDLFSGAAAVFADEFARASEREEEKRRIYEAEREAEIKSTKEDAAQFNAFISGFAQTI